MTLIQDNFSNTPMPNGLLRWFGFDFDRVELPDDPILPRGKAPVWVGRPPVFQYKNTILDASVIVDIDEWQVEPDPSYDTAKPKSFRMAVEYHGFDIMQTSIWPTWRDVQQAARDIQSRLENDFPERHANCQDENGNLTEESCPFCEGRRP